MERFHRVTRAGTVNDQEHYPSCTCPNATGPHDRQCPQAIAIKAATPAATVNVNMPRTLKQVRQYDPESLITGAEIAKGLTYTNSVRRIPGPVFRGLASEGSLTPRTIAFYAPRVPKAGAHA